MEPTHPILFFDGVCNLCNGAVQTVLLNDRRGELRFASLQSALAARLLPPAGVDPSRLDSLVLYQNGRAHTHSDGALLTARLMGGYFAYFDYLRFVPRFIRDTAYDFIARNRYRWFGRAEACMLPRPEWTDRFLET